VNTHVTVDQIKDLRRVDGVWFYLRILFPDDDEFMLDKNRPMDMHTVTILLLILTVD
jgi:hypothetical protein